MKQRKAAASEGPVADNGNGHLAEAVPDCPDSIYANSSTREDLIRQRAYELYEARNGESGSPMDDWLQAERTLSQEAASLAI